MSRVYIVEPYFFKYSKDNMKKLTVSIFIIVTLCLGFFFVKEKWFPSEKEVVVRSKTVTPVLPGDSTPQITEEVLSPEETNMTSFVPLHPGETLLNTYSIDFDLNNYDDQIIAVKRIDSSFVRIIIGLYNPLSGTYERSLEFDCGVEQSRTLSFSIMDLIGDHSNVLVITGYNDKNESIMQVYQPQTSRNQKITLRNIIDLAVEGTVFVQQIGRTESYSMGQTTGVSFPIWVYTSDTNASNSLDQIQIMYNWNPDEQQYTKSTETRITGKAIAAQELAKIQDGTEKTFASFLDKLWIKTASTGEQRYIFFDYEKREIIFLQNDTQEVYSWEKSTLRRNGILIYMTNKAMSNLERRFDIALVSTDEIRIKVADDVKMFVDAETLWDGNYKKVTNQTTAVSEKSDITNYTEILQTSNSQVWKTDNGFSLTFTGNTFKAIPESGTEIENGVFDSFVANNTQLIQFRTKSGKGSFEGVFKIAETDTGYLFSQVQVTATQVTPGSFQFSVNKITLE